LRNVSEQDRKDGYAKRIQMSIEGSTTMADVESLHASILRRLRATGIQTHMPDITTINADYCIDRARSRHKGREYLDISGYDPFGNVREPSESSGDESDDDQWSRMTIGGCGGPWRAFIWEKTHGTCGRPDFADLARRYKLLPPEELARFQTLGAQATEIGPTTHRSSFGPQGRDIQRLLSLNRERALASNVTDAGESGEHTLDLLRDTGSSMIDAAFEQSLAVLRDTGSVQAAINRGTSSLHIARREHAAKRRALLDQLVAWHKDQGVRSLSMVLQQAPLLAHIINAFIAVPTTVGVDILEYSPCNKSIATSIANIFSASRTTELGNELAQRFAARGKLKLHNDCCSICEPVIPVNEAKQAYSPVGRS
jgi:hypothetical protein